MSVIPIDGIRSTRAFLRRCAAAAARGRHRQHTGPAAPDPGRPWRTTAATRSGRALLRIGIGIAATLAVAGPARGAAPALEVDVVNASRATRCAEEDNVYVTLQAAGVTAFRITGEHPPYIGSVTTDSTAPDFTDCDMSGDPVFRFTPRTVVLHEDATLRVVGHRFATFWRPGSVEVRVGSRSEPGLHLLQLIRPRPSRDVELLVVYPSDGYWRLKPLPPPHLPDTAYGSSFLVGPVEESGRPFVALRSIDFDPATLVFRLVFGDGSSGTLAVTAATPERIELSVALQTPVPPGRPFAALRSMFVSTTQSDVTVAAWATATSPRAAAILGFDRARTRSVRFGRLEPSRHNLSAPDVAFDRFEARPHDPARPNAVPVTGRPASEAGQKP
jgi:hypothetical protein